MTGTGDEVNDIWAFLNFNYSHQGGLKIFRPSEREKIQELWGVDLPDVKPWFDIKTNNGIPEGNPDDFLNMDFVFTDAH